MSARTERRRLTPEHYFKSAAEMRALFADLPEAVDNTVGHRPALRLHAAMPASRSCRPSRSTTGRTEAEELRLPRRRGPGASAGVRRSGTPEMDAAARAQAAKPYRERLDFELGVIEQMGFPGYFLIVADFIQWAKAQGIPVGPGRGSGAGSVVAWSLTITDLDPLRWGLLFERFLNPERVSMPDFDIDFCQDRRDEVIRYVQQKYGRDRVAQIITFGTLQGARGRCATSAACCRCPTARSTASASWCRTTPPIRSRLQQAIDREPQLQQMRDGRRRRSRA